MDSREVSELAEDARVSERNVDDAVVSERAQSSDGSRFLSTTEAGSGDENSSVLVGERTLLPLATSLVPEDLEPD